MDRNKAIEIVKSHYPANKQMLNEALEFLIPELKESEDEKIRKNLIELFHDTVSNDEIFSDYGLDKTEVLAWLEKQGEQKSFARYKVGDTIYYDSFGRLVSFTIANIVEDGTDNPMYEDKDGNSVFQNDIVEKELWKQQKNDN